MSSILIACGGTGGHLAPGIALAEVLQERGHECTLLISQKQVDSILIEKYSHLNFYKTPGRAFSGGIVKRALFFWTLLAGCIHSYRMLKQKETDLVFLFGGFLSLGLGIAARILNIPIALHEANCRPGKAVRLLKYLATRLYLPDGVHLRGIPVARIRHLGYPVRRDIEHCLKAEAWERLGIAVKNKLLVIIGGSQGASILNEWAANNLQALREMEVSVYCVTGMGKIPKVAAQYSNENSQDSSVRFVEFSDQMGEVISAADLVLSRAGAGSIAEIIRCRAPAILIPYRYAADNHQHANAAMHERHGAGVVLSEKDLDKLLGEVKSLIFNDWMLNKLKSNLKRLDRFDSAECIADDVEALCVAQEKAASDSQI